MPIYEVDSDASPACDPTSRPAAPGRTGRRRLQPRARRQTSPHRRRHGSGAAPRRPRCCWSSCTCPRCTPAGLHRYNGRNAERVRNAAAALRRSPVFVCMRGRDRGVGRVCTHPRAAPCATSHKAATHLQAAGAAGRCHAAAPAEGHFGDDGVERQRRVQRARQVKGAAGQQLQLVQALGQRDGVHRQRVRPAPGRMHLGERCLRKSTWRGVCASQAHGVAAAQ